MNQRVYVNIILVGVIVILLAALGYLGVVRKQKTPSTTPPVPKQETPKVNQTPTPTPELTKEIALSLLKMECSPERVPGKYGSCHIDISKETDQWVVTITYDGLYDDSIKAERIRTIVRYKDGQWLKGEVSKTQQCWPGRGHQDFSAEPCL